MTDLIGGIIGNDYSLLILIGGIIGMFVFVIAVFLAYGIHLLLRKK